MRRELLTALLLPVGFLASDVFAKPPSGVCERKPSHPHCTSTTTAPPTTTVTTTAPPPTTVAPPPTTTAPPPPSSGTANIWVVPGG